MFVSVTTLVAIILTALTLIGTILFAVYKRKPAVWNKLYTATKHGTRALVVANRGSTKVSNNKQTPPTTKTKNQSNHSSKLKQVHFADVVSVSSVDEYSNGVNGKLKQTDSSAANLSQHPNTQKAAIRKTANNKSVVANGKPSSEPPVLCESKPHLVEINNNNFNGNQDQPLGSEPSLDELDSSVLLEVFNPTKTGSNVSAKRKNAQRSAKSTTGPRKRHSSDSNQSSYSSEQLFKMIAASTLSRDEVEIAVETLLNKLESGETDWQKPKSDPLQRLKNQLRDSEAMLSTEVQNHEQTRARLNELKTQLQNERSSKSSTGEELTKLRKDLLTTSAALERTNNELSKQRILHEKTRDESSKIINKLEEDNVRLENLLANSNAHHDELTKLRHELNENVEQLQGYEAANDSLKQRIHELEANLRSADVRFDRMRTEMQQDDYEACAKISELESDRAALEKALKDHMIRLNEVSEANKLLETSFNDMQLSNAHKEDVIKRLTDEKRMNEASMKRTLFEMEQELRKLHERLSHRMATDDEKHRRELDQFERELTNAGQREQKLKSSMKQLREGLSELFPDLKSNKTEQSNSDDWVHHYLNALRQLTATVDKLRQSNGTDHQNKENGENGRLTDSPSKRSVKSSLSMSHPNGKLSRVGSPVSNGRSSRASTNRDHDKKLMEAKLVESSGYSDEESGHLETNNNRDGGNDFEKEQLEQQIQDLLLNRKKLEFQIKVGLDSFKMEQKRVKQLEEELSIYRKNQSTNGTVL